MIATLFLAAAFAALPQEPAGDARLDALRRAAAHRAELDDAALDALAAPPVPARWAQPGALMDVVAAAKIPSWYGLLVPLFTDPDPAIRRRAVEELGRRDLARWSAPVVPVLRDLDGTVAWQAAFTLILMDARDRVAEIAALLRGAEPSAQLKILHVMGRLGSRSDGRLVAPLLEDPDPDVSQTAVETLGLLKARDFAARVARFLDDPEGPRRQAAIEALAGMEARDFADKIAERLADDQILVRWEAVRALGRLKAKAHAGEIVGLIEEDGAQAPVIEALGSLGLRELAPNLIPFLEFPEPGIRWRAVRSLGQVDARSDAALLAARLKDEDGFVRLTALRALAAMGATEQAPEMLALLHDEEAEVCQSVAEESFALVTPAQLKGVVPLLADEDPFTRWSALHLLEAAGAREALPAIAERLKTGGMNWNLIWAIGRLGGREQAELVRAAIADADAFVRQQALFAWARISDDAGPLEAAEREGSPSQRLAASIGLVRRGRKERAAEAAILKDVLARRQDPECQYFAAELIDALTAAHEPGLVVALSKELRPAKRVETLVALQALLREAGLELVPGAEQELRRRLPEGRALSAGRVLEWSFGPGVHPLLQEGKLRVRETDEALEDWRKRLR